MIVLLYFGTFILCWFVLPVAPSIYVRFFGANAEKGHFLSSSKGNHLSEIRWKNLENMEKIGFHQRESVKRYEKQTKPVVKVSRWHSSPPRAM